MQTTYQKQNNNQKNKWNFFSSVRWPKIVKCYERKSKCIFLVLTTFFHIVDQKWTEYKLKCHFTELYVSISIFLCCSNQPAIVWTWWKKGRYCLTIFAHTKKHTLTHSITKRHMKYHLYQQFQEKKRSASQSHCWNKTEWFCAFFFFVSLSLYIFLVVVGNFVNVHVVWHL